MPTDHELSEILFRCVFAAGQIEEALENRKRSDVEFRDVCPPKQYRPDSNAKNFAEQEARFGRLQAARELVERHRTKLLCDLLKARHLIEALASRQGLPKWSIDLPVLMETIVRLHHRVESTTRPLELHRRAIIEEWHSDLDLLLTWKRQIEAYEDLQAAPADSADKPTRAKPRGEKSNNAQKRMLSLFKKDKLPQSLRQVTKLLRSEDFSYNTVRTAAHKSLTLRAHFKLGTATDDPNGTTRSLLDELAQQTDRRTEQAIRSMSPHQRAKTEAQLRKMPASNALELMKTLAQNPDAGRTADVAYIEEADQDHRDDDV